MTAQTEFCIKLMSKKPVLDLFKDVEELKEQKNTYKYAEHPIFQSMSSPDLGSSNVFAMEAIHNMFVQRLLASKPWIEESEVHVKSVILDFPREYPIEFRVHT